jgi:hypothetical protein
MLKTTVLFGLFILISGCGGKSSEPNVELIQDMMVGPQIKSQKADANNKGTGMIPPKGSIPRERYVPEDLKLEEAEKFSNPLKSSNLSTELSLKYENIGQAKFEINCAICHGSKGNGLGPLVEKRGDMLLKKPPSLLTDTYKNYSDGRLYYVITYGWGLMGNYSTQITDENERWAVVNYVRQLQQLGSNKSNSGDK